jgi:threonine/homoserine/homoserine lactone efflux protein
LTAPAFMTAVFLLLLTPGPTNTLLAVAGGSAGFRRSLHLIAAEAAGYLLTIVPLATFAGPYLATHPTAASAIKLCSAVWVLLLAAKLWTNSPAGIGAPLVTFRQVFVTTVLNPKALIFGLVLLPHGSLQAMLPWLGMFLAIVLTVACLWLSSGATLIRRANGEFPPLLRRIAASLLLCFAAGLAGSSLGLI